MGRAGCEFCTFDFNRVVCRGEKHRQEGLNTVAFTHLACSLLGTGHFCICLCCGLLSPLKFDDLVSASPLVKKERDSVPLSTFSLSVLNEKTKFSPCDEPPHQQPTTYKHVRQRKGRKGIGQGKSVSLMFSFPFPIFQLFSAAT